MSDEKSVFSEAPKFNYQEPARDTDWQAFMDVVESRRSVRVYEPEPIPEEIVRNCLRAALLAPTSSNLQPWEFYWVRTPERKASLVKACFSQPAAKTAAEIIVCVARTKTIDRNRHLMLKTLQEMESRQERVPASLKAYYAKLIPMVYTQGPLSLLGLLRKAATSLIGLVRPVPREPNSKSQLQTWAVKTCALACQNLMLAFRAAGYDSCPMEGLDSRRVKKILNLPNDAIVVMAISAGRRAPNGIYGRRIRFDENLFLFEV